MTLYTKKPNGRYKEVGAEWTGFPKDGIWLVKDGRRNQKWLIHEGEVDPIPLAALFKYHNEVCSALLKLREERKAATYKKDGERESWQSPSVSDEVDCMFKVLANHALGVKDE